MRPINVELLQGHDVGVSSAYYRPTEKELLEDYLRAVPYLTLTHEERLRSQAARLESRINSDAHAISDQKEQKIQELQDKHDRLVRLLVERGVLKPE